MKKSINIWSFPQGTSIKKAMQMAKKYEYDGIELALDEKGLLSLESTDSDILSVRKMADELGITICSLATGLYWEHSLTSEIDAVREKSKKIVRAQLHAARLLGVTAILVVPGCVGADFIPACPIVSYDSAYERSMEALKELAKDAERENVIIALENVWNKFLLSPLEMRDFIDEIDSPFVKAYFDTANVLLTGYPEHWIKILGDRIACVHIKDFSRAIGTINGFVPLLCGDANFSAIMKALRETGFDGYLTAEMNGFSAKDDVVIAHTADALNRIMNL